MISHYILMVILLFLDIFSLYKSSLSNQHHLSITSHVGMKCRHTCLVHFTFNSFPEVIAVSPYRGEFAQVVVGAPDVHVFILRAAHDERVIMTRRRKYVAVILQC